MSKILIYYRDKEHFDQGGEITSCHLAGADWTEAETAKKIAEYNARGENKNVAAYVAVEDSGLEMYLYRRAERHVIYQKEAVRDAIESVERALDDLRCLD